MGNKIDKYGEIFGFNDDFGDNDNSNQGCTLRTDSPNAKLRNLDDFPSEFESEPSEKEPPKITPSVKPQRIIKKKDVNYTIEKPMSEKAKSAHKKIIDCVAMLFESMLPDNKTAEENEQENDEEQVKKQVRKKVREYSNSADMEKIVFRKPKTEGSILPKLIMFLCACAATGTALGLQSSSYYNYALLTGKKIESTMSCMWLWLLEEGMPFNPSPLNSSVFISGFVAGFLILAVIGLFIWLDNDTKKQSRVGHEHGNARLGTSKDFKNFRNRFMEK